MIDSDSSMKGYLESIREKMNDYISRFFQADRELTDDVYEGSSEGRALSPRQLEMVSNMRRFWDADRKWLVICGEYPMRGSRKEGDEMVEFHLAPEKNNNCYAIMEMGGKRTAVAMVDGRGELRPYGTEISSELDESLIGSLLQARIGLTEGFPLTHAPVTSIVAVEEVL